MFIRTVIATTFTYTEHDGNGYSGHTGDFGAKSLDHCERSGSNLDQCKEWCNMDCECECIVVFKSNGACFRRHSCDPAKLDVGNPPLFATYIKDNFTSNCSNFHDFGYDTRCAGATLPPLIATNIGSLEQCKHLCTTLSFECKGIEYLSNCSDTTSDTCLIYTSAVSSGTTTTPLNADSSYHCLQYTGEVRSLAGGLILPVSFGIEGIDGVALTGNPQMVAIFSNFMKEMIANQSSHITTDDVSVTIQPDPFKVETFIETPNGQVFYGVSAALQDQTVQDGIRSAATNFLNNSQGLSSVRQGGGINVTDLVFNFSAVEFLTSTITTTTQPNNDTTTDQVTVSGTHQIRILGTIFIWFAACCI